jgi:hypothetical protein
MEELKNLLIFLREKYYQNQHVKIVWHQNKKDQEVVH